MDVLDVGWCVIRRFPNPIFEEKGLSKCAVNSIYIDGLFRRYELIRHQVRPRISQAPFLHQMTADLEEIRMALKLTPGLDTLLVERRAKAIYDVLTAIGMVQFKIEQPIGIPLPGTDNLFPLVQYTFGCLGRSVEMAQNPWAVKKSINEMEGTGVDREDIQYFAKVCDIGQTLIPHLWPAYQTITNGLIEPDTHLNTLNEVWWLARWSGIDWSATQSEHPMGPKSPHQRKTVDWRLRSLDNWAINIEVKNFSRAQADRTYKKTPSFYRANGLTHKGEPDADDPRLKFRQSAGREINVLAVTRHDEISNEFEGWVEDFLDASSFPPNIPEIERADKIDAVVVWSRADRRRGGWRRFFPRFRDISAKREVLMRLLIEPDYEDRSRPFAQRYAKSLTDVLGEGLATS
jgi:hypothetical protein